MAEESADSLLAVIQVVFHFVGCISLCHKCDMDAVRRVFGLLQYIVWGDVTLSGLSDQDIRRNNGVGHGNSRFVVIVIEFYGDINGIFWEWN